MENPLGANVDSLHNRGSGRTVCVSVFNYFYSQIAAGNIVEEELESYDPIIFFHKCFPVALRYHYGFWAGVNNIRNNQPTAPPTQVEEGIRGMTPSSSENSLPAEPLNIP